MATIHLKNVILYDRWPGVPNPNLGVPTDGFDATIGHSCVTAPAYPPGTKIQGWQEDASRSSGPYTMIYLNFHEVSGQNPPDMSHNYGFVTQAEFSGSGIAADGGGDVSCSPWNVANVPNVANFEISTKFPKAVACSTKISSDTTAGSGQWGWFWCGGLCPWVDCPALDCEVTTDGAVSLKQQFMWVEDTSVITLGDFTPGESTDIPGGYTLVADA
jgi:hypothetical protein